MKKSIAVFMMLATMVVAYSQDGNLKKQTYFRFGLSSPTWKYFGNDDKSDWDSDVKKIGGIFEVGSIFMLNSIKIAPGMRLGINLDYLSVNYHRFKDTEDKSTYSFVYVGSKIGPSFSYSPVDRLVFDAYFKFHPVWIDAAFFAYNDELVEDDLFMGFMGLKYSVGLNVRYSVLMLGFEFNPGIAKFRYYDTEENKLSDEYMENVNDNSKKIPVPGINFTLGLSL
jgi:hypothetical protein